MHKDWLGSGCSQLMIILRLGLAKAQMHKSTDMMKRMVVKDCWTCLFTFAPETDTLPASPTTISYKM